MNFFVSDDKILFLSYGHIIFIITYILLLIISDIVRKTLGQTFNNRYHCVTINIDVFIFIQSCIRRDKAYVFRLVTRFIYMLLLENINRERYGKTSATEIPFF